MLIRTTHVDTRHRMKRSFQESQAGLFADLLKQAFDEARNRGLITAREAQGDKLPAWLMSEKMGRR
jgi:hypothetical protein